MQTKEGNTLLSLRTAQEFLERNTDVLPEVAKTGVRQRLDEVIVALDGHASSQEGSSIAMRGATKLLRTRRTTLRRDHMAPIARIAKLDLPPIPQLQALRMPRGRPTVERLAAAAAGMAEAARPYADVIVAAGRPVDFLERLLEASDALVASYQGHIVRRGQLKGATRGLRAKLTTGRKLVHVLDALVQSELQHDPARLADWSVVMRVQKKKGGRSQIAGPVPTPTPAPTGFTSAPASPTPAVPGAPASVITAA
jgi:hypothetical protein